MGYLVAAGIALTLCGLVLLAVCIVGAWRLRRSGLTDAAMRARLQRLVAWNFGALGLATLGLLTVLVGVVLAPAA